MVPGVEGSNPFTHPKKSLVVRHQTLVETGAGASVYYRPIGIAFVSSSANG